jgi:hypothetical protein
LEQSVNRVAACSDSPRELTWKNLITNMDWVVRTLRYSHARNSVSDNGVEVKCLEPSTYQHHHPIEGSGLEMHGPSYGPSYCSTEVERMAEMLRPPPVGFTTRLPCRLVGLRSRRFQLTAALSVSLVPRGMTSFPSCEFSLIPIGHIAGRVSPAVLPDSCS